MFPNNAYLFATEVFIECAFQRFFANYSDKYLQLFYLKAEKNQPGNLITLAYYDIMGKKW